MEIKKVDLIPETPRDYKVSERTKNILNALENLKKNEIVKVSGSTRKETLELHKVRHSVIVANKRFCPKNYGMYSRGSFVYIERKE